MKFMECCCLSSFIEIDGLVLKKKNEHVKEFMTTIDKGQIRGKCSNQIHQFKAKTNPNHYTTNNM